MSGDGNASATIERDNFIAEAAAPSVKAPAAVAAERSSIPWQRELLVLFLRNQIRVAPAMPILAFLLAITTLQWSTPYVSMLWLVAAMLTALASLGAQASRDLLEEALGDPDWAVRVKSASLLRGLDPASDASARMRPAPAAPGGYDTPELVSPSVSPHVFVDTAEGTIEIELARVDHWVKLGAQQSDRVRALVSSYRKQAVAAA